MKTGMRSTMFVTGLFTIMLLFIKMAESDRLRSDQMQIRNCRQFTADTELKNLIVVREQNVTRCACHEQQIQLDYTFERLENNCYQEWFFKDGVKQQCCYGDNGKLLVGAPNGGYLVLMYGKLSSSSIHKSCCQTGEAYNRELCEGFYSTNPSDTCTLYHPIESVMSWGDPTIETLNERKFDFNGHGEYIFLNTSNVEVQVRTSYVNPSNSDATIFTACAIFDKRNSSVTEIYCKQNCSVIYATKNGKALCNISSQTMRGPPCSMDQQCPIMVGPGKLIVTNCGFGDFAKQIEFLTGDFMSIKITKKTSSTLPEVGGLAGQLDEEMLVCRNGSMVMFNESASILFDCTETWRLKSVSESYFNYTLTGGNFTDNNKYSRPRFLEDLVNNLTLLFENCTTKNISLFNDTCRNYWDRTSNKECLLAIARTCNYDFGVAVMQRVNEERRQWIILHNEPPKFNDSIPDDVTVTSKRNLTWTLNLTQYVSDDEPLTKLTYSVDTKLPESEYILSHGLFIWNISTSLRNITTSLLFRVLDLYNFSATHEIKIRYCGCEQPNECDFNASNPLSTDQMFVAACSCQDYYYGPFCSIYRDPCSDIKCIDQSLCNSNVSKQGNHSAWPCAECPNGYRGNIINSMQNCTDVDECAADYHGDNKCEQKCTNTIGSFSCSCLLPGYTLNKDNYTCDDVDECKTQTCPANEVCVNFPGNYTCECAPSFTRVGHGLTCTRVEGSTFVGSILFHITSEKTDFKMLNETIDSIENKNKIKYQLEKGFNCTAVPMNDTGRCTSVKVVQLIIILDTRYKRDVNIQAQLKVDYIVSWSRKEDNNKIQNSLQTTWNDNSNTQSQNSELKGITFILKTDKIIETQGPQGGLCSVANATDCDPVSTKCVNYPPYGEFNCTCLSGFNILENSKTHCIDENECVTFAHSITTNERCVHGYCENTVGSWNCSCPPDRQWQSVGNDSYSQYRCQGNFSYIGRLEIGWSSNDTQGTKFELIRNALKEAFLNSTVKDSITDVRLKDLLVSVTVLQLTEVNGSSGNDQNSNSTATFNLRMGEVVNISGIINVLDDAFKKGRIDSRYHIWAGSVHMYKDSENMMCRFTNNGSCDEKTTICQQKGVSTHCICKDGFDKKDETAKFCNDVDECANKTRIFCSGLGNCLNTDGSYSCDCKPGYEINATNPMDIACEDLNECTSTDYVCEGGTCENGIGNWSCHCNGSGYIKTMITSRVFLCKDIDECSNSSYHCGGGECLNKDGSWECSCDRGYTKNITSESNITCDEIDECKAFNRTIDKYCINGVCSNLPGSWNCTCLDDRLWTVMPNGTYRCQGNFTYFGSISLLADTNSSLISRLIYDYIKQLYQSTYVNETGNMELRLLFVSVNVFNVSEVPSSIGALRNYTLMFSLRMGDSVSVESLQSVIGEYNISKTFHLNETTIIIYSNLIYTEDRNILCNLTNFGGCDPISTSCKQANGSTHCVCKPGFENHPDQSKFCYDIDECKSNGTCSGHGHCSNEIGSYTCECYDGYYMNTSDKHSIACEDINECLSKEANCSGHGKCQNIPGHYNCTCHNGFKVKNINGKYPVCEDIDECEVNGTCEHGKCFNNVGSYTCTCLPGYTLIENHTCQDINECASDGICSGHGICTNTDGSYNCDCEDGYMLNSSNTNNITCDDIDECTNTTICPDNSECLNQPGNYTCQCMIGFEIGLNGTFCIDIDECSTTKPCMNTNTYCQNTPGSFRCQCNFGYKDVNDTCEDIDECSNGKPCTGNKCVNYPGGYNCTCRDGYISSENTTECQDIDECNQTNSTFCSPHGQCTNTDGGYTCMCDEGYTKNTTNFNNITCEDIDECHNTSYFCGGNCNNMNGAWSCECKAGYTKTKTKNSIVCTDIDECVQNRKACVGGFCQNTNGSWTCSCGEGKEVKVINETTKECSGGYQYVVTLGFAAAVSSTQNMDENNTKLKDYFKMQITEAYRTSFPHSVVKVDILSIKHSQRVKRQTSTGLVNWEVDFVLNIDKPVEQTIVESALTNYTEKCQPNCQVHGEPPPFNILLEKVVVKTDPATVLCDYYRYCDEDTTHCEYVNHTTQCTCRKGYIPKENTDAKCQVVPGVCNTSLCENGATCMLSESSRSFTCICQNGWTGDICNIKQTFVVGNSGPYTMSSVSYYSCGSHTLIRVLALTNRGRTISKTETIGCTSSNGTKENTISLTVSDHSNTMMIAVGGSLGGVVIILLVTIFVVCKWRGKKIKEAEKIALKKMDTNGFKPFDGSLYDDRYIGDSQHNSLERQSMTSYRDSRPNGTPVQNGHRLSAANLYATPHKLPKQTIHGSMIDLTNGHANYVHDEPRRLSVQDPQRHIASNMGWSYTANNRPLSSNGDILRKHLQPDYDDRPPSPKPDYHHNERLDASRDSGLGVGYASNGSTSNDYRRPNHLRRTSFEGPNGESRF